MTLVISRFLAAGADAELARIDQRLRELQRDFRRIERDNGRVNQALRDLDRAADRMSPGDAAEDLADLKELAERLNNEAEALAGESGELQRRRAAITGEAGGEIDWWSLLRDIGLIIGSIAALWAMFAGGGEES